MAVSIRMTDPTEIAAERAIPPLDWFVNRDGRFEPMLPEADGLLQSTAFPGLWLDRNAALARRL